ncbi:MAG: hypothetical protein JSV46_02420, partial [Candidatus Aminicenantes bacterium]
RRTTRKIDLLFIISDHTPVGLRSAGRIRDLVKELELDVKAIKLIINKAAQGKNLAYFVNQFLENKHVTGPSRRFQSMMRKICEEEVSEFLKGAEEHERIVPKGGFKDGYADEEAVRESKRCFGCDCRKPDSCKLRQYSEVYQADQRRFTYVERKRFQKNIQHDHVIYESGKCIKCGLCVQITKKAGEKLGLTFVGRGFDVRVETPFGEPLSQGLKKVAADCISACPTGALSWRDRRKNEDATN